jgi:YfiH family protein
MNNDIKIYQHKNFNEDNITYAFTGRSGGVSEEPFSSLNLAFHVGDNLDQATKNRELLSENLGFDFDKLSWASQVHGDNIFILRNEKEAGFLGEYDGIITNLHNFPVMTLFADCIPVLLHDPEKNVVATIHAGWKGTFLEIALKAVHIMSSEFGSKPENIKALIGPGICKDHYEVSEELIRDFSAKFPEAVNDDLKNLDLRKINFHILKKAGLKKIYDMEICTSCDNKNFFSYREEKGITGRFAALIMLK